MSLRGWMNQCVESGTQKSGEVAGYGAAVGSMFAGAGAAPGAAVGAKVGGVYGCLSQGDGVEGLKRTFNGAARAVEKEWDRARRVARRAYRWTRDLFGGGGKKKKRSKRSNLPVLDDAVSMMIFHLANRGGSPTGQAPYQFELPAARGGWAEVPAGFPLHASVRVDLFGDAAAEWDPDTMYAAIATLWAKTPRTWKDGVRWVVTIRRLGDYLVEAPAGTPIEVWPIVPPRAEDPQALKRRLLEEINDEIPGTAGDLSAPGIEIGGAAATGAALLRAARRVLGTNKEAA